MNALDVGDGVDILPGGYRHFVNLLVAVAVEEPQQPILAADADHLVLFAVDGGLE